MNEYSLILDSDGKSVLQVKEKYSYEAGFLDNPQKAANFINTVFNLGNRAEEYVFMVCVNATNHPIGCFEVSHGTVDTSLLTPREVLVRSLLCGATGFFLFHNHPSQKIKPSEADILATKRIKEAADLVGITLIDHVIVSKSDYYSLKENFMM